MFRCNCIAGTERNVKIIIRLMQTDDDDDNDDVLEEDRL